MTASRLRLRARQRVQARRMPVRRLPEMLVLAAMTALVIGALVATTKGGGGWRDIAHGQAVNVASATAIALFAYLLFVLRFRRAELNDYLELCRARPERFFASPPTESWREAGDRFPLADCVVEDTVEARTARSHLLVGDVDGRRRMLLQSIVQKLAARRYVPVVVEMPAGTSAGSITSIARERFITQLVGASGDPRNAGRLFNLLIQNGRLVVVVDGLERVGEGKSPSSRRERVGGLLAECLVDGVQFVAAVEESLAPELSELSVIRTGRMPAAELAAFLLAELAHAGVDPTGLDDHVASVFKGSEPTRDPGLLRLAVRLIRRDVRSGLGAAEAVEIEFGDACAIRRHLRWMCRWALGCELDDVGNERTPEALALAVLGHEALYAQTRVVTVRDAYSGMDPAERRKVQAGLARLEERGVVSVATVDGAEVARFLHPAWVALAGLLAGRFLDRSLWPDLVRHDAPRATLAAVTASLLLDAKPGGGGRRSFVDVLRGLGLRAPVDASLDLVAAAVTALQADPSPLAIGDEELAWLDRAWEDATEPARVEFLARVDFSRHRRLLEFLWGELVPPRFGLNSWRLRMAVCRRLIDQAPGAWDVLGDRWARLVVAGAAADLSTVARDRPDYQAWGLSLASLGWVLPGVLLNLEGHDAEPAERLLVQLVALVCRRQADDGSGIPAPDLGLEISLADGFKVAAGYTRTTPDEGLDTLESHASALLTSARSWLSRLVLLQALGLSNQSAAGSERVSALLLRTAADRLEHPFVREGAAALIRGPDVAGVVGKDLWRDEPEVLDDGGLDLAPSAHRLLGLSTLLVNFAEHALWRAREGDRPRALADAADIRERALTDRRLPPCFIRASHAATMFQHPCTCEFALCGPDALGLVGFRHPSRAFVQRSEAVCGAPTWIGSGRHGPFATAAFRGSWRLLDGALDRSDRPRAHDR